MKRTISLILVLMLIAGLCMMQVGFAEEKKVVKYSIADDPQQMDPTLNTYSRSSIVLQTLPGLYKLGPDGVSFIPALRRERGRFRGRHDLHLHAEEGLKWSDAAT